MATHSSILVWRVPTDRGTWQATVHGVAKSWSRLRNMVRDQGNETGKGEKPNNTALMCRLLFWAQVGFSFAGNFLGNWNTQRIVPPRGKQLV